MNSDETKTFIFYVNKQTKILHKPLAEIQKDVTEAIENNPQDIESQLILEQILFKYFLDYTQSLKIIKRILEIDSKNVEARLDLIQIIFDFKLCKTEQCFQLLEECLQIDPEYWRIHFTHIRLLDHIGNNDSKINIEIDRCLIQYPENKQFQIYQAQVQSEQESKSEEVAEQLDPLKHSVDLDFDLLRRISYSYGNINKGEEALAYVQKSIQFNPNSYISYNEYAYLERVINNNLQKCQEYCLKSIELNPNYSFTLNNLAITYKNLNKKDECVSCLKRTLKLKNSPSIYQQLVYDLYDFRDLQHAQYYSHKCVQKYPNDVSSNYLLQQIHRRVFSITINDYEQHEIQSFKCLNFFEDLYANEYSLVLTSINEVYE